MSHGDLLLVQRQSVWGRSHLASTAVLIRQHGRFGHLRMEERKEVVSAPHPPEYHPAPREDQCDSALTSLGLFFICEEKRQN